MLCLVVKREGTYLHQASFPGFCQVLEIIPHPHPHPPEHKPTKLASANPEHQSVYVRVTVALQSFSPQLRTFKQKCGGFPYDQPVHLPT